MPHMPKYKISDISVRYCALAEKDFGGICKAFLLCSRKNTGMGRFFFRVYFKVVHPKSNSYCMRYVGVKCSAARNC